MKQGRPGLTRLVMLNSLLVGLRGQAASAEAGNHPSCISLSVIRIEKWPCDLSPKMLAWWILFIEGRGLWRSRIGLTTFVLS